MYISDGLFGIPADLLQAAEWQELALVLHMGRHGVARRPDVVFLGGHSGGRGAVR